MKSQSAYKILKYIDEQLKTTYDTLNEMERGIEDYKREHGLDSLTIGIKEGYMLNSKITELENEIREA